MTKIHWLGIGLSSVPGIKRLANLDTNFVLWCRRTDEGKKCWTAVSPKRSGIYHGTH